MPTASVSYFVCATPRSGSTLLCESLKATGVAGRPEEYFEAVPDTGRPRAPEHYLQGLDDPSAWALLGRSGAPESPPYSSLAGVRRYRDHVARVRAWGTTPNGVFGAKLMWAHIGDLVALTEQLRDCRGLEPAPRLAALFGPPKYVWVRRRERVRQAVSLWRAMQTHSWRADDDRGNHQPRYSYAALRHLVGLLSADDAAWERFFANVPQPVLTVEYDDLAGDLSGELARTLAHIGVEGRNGRLAGAPMRRQADDVSDAWAAAYARDAAAGDRAPSTT